MKSLKNLFVLGLCLSLCCACVLAEPASAPANSAKPRNVTFISTSDSHYKAFESAGWNEYNRESIQEINRIAGQPWPEKLGGGAIDTPRGVVLLGDCIDDGDMVRGDKDYTAEQFKHFLAQMGFDGTDGLLKFRVFETWGNHDGPPTTEKMRSRVSFQAELKKRNALRKEKGWLTNLSENGLHYSWDWDDVHLVSLGIYPADVQNAKIRYSAKWHNPQGALTFLKDDLARHVGDSGRPVVLMSHAGFDTDWWHKDDWKALYDAVKRYNIVLYLYGHTGTGLRDWAPALGAPDGEGEPKKWTCINDGNTTAGFFVIQIEGDTLRAGYRCKENVKVTRNPDRTYTRQWDGQWGWRFLLERKLTAAPAKAEEPAPAATPAAAPSDAPAAAEYKVDPTRVVGQIDVGIHGQFLEHIFNSVHGGLWGDLVLNPSLESASRGEWVVKGGVIGTTKPVTDRRLIFGDSKWGDYELTLEARCLEGDEGFIVLFRVADQSRFYWANMGGWGNKQHAIEKSRRPMQPMVDGQIEKDKWYRVRIRCAGPKLGVWLDDKQVIDQSDPKDPILRGAVGLTGWNTRVEFRNIKIASLDGKTLFDGLPLASALARPPAYWSFFGDTEHSFPSAGALSDGTSLRLRRGQGREEGGIRQGPIPLRQGEHYRGSLWARGRDGAALQVRLMDEQGQAVIRQDLGRPGGEWKKLTFDFTAPRAVGDATLEIVLSAAGEADVDMVSLFAQAALDAGGFRPDLLKAVAELHPASIRYPGGCFASAYRWRDGIGPREKRTYFPRVIWADQDPSQMGTDEFLDLCRRVGAEPIIVVNINQSVEEALDWLEYCNGPADSKWGGERARNGHPQPYNVKLWEIDNETWGMGPEKYADAVIKFGRALRKKDPSIKVLACGGYGYDDGKGSTNGWNKRLLDKAAKDFDYLSIHYYNGIRYAQDHVDDPRRYEAYMRDEIGKLIRESANPAVRVYCSEWGMMNDQWRSGLYAGSILNAFERISELCPMACTAVWLQTVTRERPRPRWASCSILFDHQTCYAAPACVVQKLWRDHFAPKRVKLDGPERPLDVIATLSEDGKTLYLKGVNPTGQAQDVGVTIADGFKPAKASLLLVTGRLDNRNTLDEPNTLAPKPAAVELDAQVVRFSLPAHSAGAVTVSEEK